MADQVEVNDLLNTVQAAVDSAEAGTAKDPKYLAAGYFTINTRTAMGECTIAFSNHNEYRDEDYDDDGNRLPEAEHSIWCNTWPMAVELITDPNVDLHRWMVEHIFRSITYNAERWNMSGAEVLDGFKFYPRATARGPHYQWPVPPTPTVDEHDPSPLDGPELLPYPPEMVDRIAEFDEAAELRNYMRFLVKDGRIPTPAEKAELDAILAKANQRKNERLAAPSN